MTKWIPVKTRRRRHLLKKLKKKVKRRNVSSLKELCDTLDVARSFKTMRRDTSISGQEVKKNFDSVLQRDLNPIFKEGGHTGLMILGRQYLKDPNRQNFHFLSKFILYYGYKRSLYA